MSAPVAIVTGASSGIGRATALRLAASGHHLVLVARRQAALEELALVCSTAGASSAEAYAADVSDDAAIGRLFAEVVERHGVIDVVVNSAGIVAYGRTESVPADVFDRVIKTNLIGSVTVSRHAVTAFRLQNKGHLVLVGSVIGHIGVPTMSPYVLSKWGVRALSEQLVLENRDRPGIRISYIAPGGVTTPIYNEAANYAGFGGRPPPPATSAEVVARAIERTLQGRRHRSQVGRANDLIRFGHTFLPVAYRWLVGPLFSVAARDLTKPVEPTTGNVLDPSSRYRTSDPSLAGGVTALVRNVRVMVRGNRS